MNNRRYFNKLIAPNTQFLPDEERFNHDAIAIYLHEKNKRVWKNRPVYLVAGSEDLRDLLTRLPLQFDGDEAFIFFRSHVHAIVISLLRLNGKLIAYYYDPQAWGTQNYPTRLAYDALINTYPDISIFISTVEIQSQSNQRGCTEYALDSLDYLLKVDCNWIAMLPAQRTTEATAPFFKLDKDVYPQILKGLSVRDRHTQNINELEKWLVESYINKNNDDLQWLEIERVVRLMQGAELPQCLFDSPKLYTTSVNLDQPSVTLTFTHGNYVHANCLTFTNSIYPSSRTGGLVMDDSKHVKVKHDANAKTLTFTADSVEKLLSEFTELLKSPGRYQARQMRQQQALHTFANDILLAIQIERELVAVLNSSKGGMDPRQVQLALQFIFRNDQATIYVPHYIELSGENSKLNLNDLNNRGLKTLVSTLPLDNEHQVAVKIDLTQSPFNVSIFNSSSYGYAESSLKLRLKRILGEQIEVHDVPTHFKKQTDEDIWACGIHVIANIEAELGRRACSKSEVLDAQALARTYLRAWRHQQDEDEKQWNYRHACTEFTENLYKTLVKNSGYPVESLLRFLSNYIGNSHSELRRATPTAQLLREYDKANSQDTSGIIVLRFCNLVFPKLDEAELLRILAIAKNPPRTQGLYEHAEKKYDSSWTYGNTNKLTDQTFDAVVVDMQLFIKQQVNPLEFLRTAVIQLLSNKLPADTITDFFKLIDCEYPITQIDDKNRFIQLMILEICSQANKYDGVILGEKRNIQLERIAKDERIKKLLSQLGVYRGEMTPEVTELLQHPENVMINITSKVHVAILSVVTDDRVKASVIKGFIKSLSSNKNKIFDLLNLLDLTLRAAAAQALLTTVPAEVLARQESANGSRNDSDTDSGSDDDNKTVAERLRTYILDNSVDEHIKNPESLIACVREWKNSGMNVSLNMLKKYKKRLSSDVVSRLFAIIVGDNWNEKLLKKYLKYFEVNDYFSAVSIIIPQSDVKFLLAVMQSRTHHFSDDQLIRLLALFKGRLTVSTVSSLFGCRHGLNPTYPISSGTQISIFDRLLCEWLFVNRSDALSLKQFLCYASKQTLEAVCTERSESFATMIAAWGTLNYPIHRLETTIDAKKIYNLYPQELRIDEDILIYIRSLPAHEKAVAIMRCHPPTKNETLLKDVLRMLKADERLVYLRKHLEKFESTSVIATIIKELDRDPFVLEVVKAKGGLFKGVVCKGCGNANCGNRGSVSGPVQVLDYITHAPYRYDALVLLLEHHHSVEDVFSSLGCLTDDNARKFLSTFYAPMADIISRSRYDFISKIRQRYDSPTALNFVQHYLPFFNADNIKNALSFNPSLTTKHLMRGKPLLRDSAELHSIQRAAQTENRYLILQRNIKLLKYPTDCVKEIEMLPANDAVRFLLDYEDFIVGLYEANPRSSFRDIASLRAFSENAEICKQYLRHPIASSEYLTLLKKPCLTNDERMEVLLQTGNNIKDSFMRCVESVQGPHRDMLTFLQSQPTWLSKLASDGLITCFKSVLPSDMLTFLLYLIRINVPLTSNHVLAVVSNVPAEHKLQFITAAVELPGDERWYLLRHLPDNNAAVTLACSMINTEADLLKFVSTNANTSVVAAVLSAKNHLITSENLISIMSASNPCCDYIETNKLDLIQSPQQLRQALCLLPSERRYKTAIKFIKDFDWLVAVMHCVNEKQAEEALRFHEGLITHNSDISLCLHRISASSRLDIATRYETYTQTQEHFERMVLALNQIDGYSYVRIAGFSPTISDKWLLHFRPIDRYEYLSNRKLKESELFKAILCLSSEHRLIFACENLSAINSLEIFSEIRDSFQNESRVMLDFHWQRALKKKDEKKPPAKEKEGNKSIFWGMFTTDPSKKDADKKPEPAQNKTTAKKNSSQPGPSGTSPASTRPDLRSGTANNEGQRLSDHIHIYIFKPASARGPSSNSGNDNNKHTQTTHFHHQ